MASNYELKKATFDAYMAFVSGLEHELYGWTPDFEKACRSMGMNSEMAYAAILTKCAIRTDKETGEVSFHVASIGTVRKAWQDIAKVSRIDYKTPKAPKAPKGQDKKAAIFAEICEKAKVSPEVLEAMFAAGYRFRIVKNGAEKAA